MAIKIFNTLSGKKEEFTPILGNSVNMYACGITVSGEAHIGHAYQALIYDIIRKYLEKSGYNVKYARNYTDVDDKIIAKSNETGIPADVYAETMIKHIDEQMARLNPLPSEAPSISPGISATTKLVSPTETTPSIGSSVVNG